MTKAKVGAVQLRVMRALWKLKTASARELTDELTESDPIAHSTVQTLLRQLEAKGAVAHKKEDRTFYFYPLIKEEEVKRSAARELIQNVFVGDAGGLLSYLLETERLSKRELARLRRLIDEKENESKRRRRDA